MLFPAINTIALVAFFACAFATMLQYDRIVRLERNNHKAAWLLDGSPAPIFSFSGNASVSQVIVRTRLSFIWLFSIPLWARNDNKAKRLFTSYRITWFLLLIAWLLLAKEMITRFNA